MSKLAGNQIAGTVPLLVAGLVALAGWWTDREVNQAIQANLKDHLETVLKANVTALEIWMRNQERLAAGIANDPQVVKLCLGVLDSREAQGTNRQALARLPQHPELAATLAPRLQTAGYLAAQLVSTNLVIVGDSGRGRMRVGSPVSEEHEAKFAELFASGQAVVITPFRPPMPRRPGFGDRPGRRFGWGGPGATNAPDRGTASMPPPDGSRLGPPSGPPFKLRRDVTLMQVAAPVRDANGEVKGALAFIIRPEAEFTRVLSVARPGATGETFAFDQNGLMISQSRFDAQLKAVGLLDNAPDVSSALTLELRDPGGDLTRGYRAAPSATPRPLTRMVADAVQGGEGIEVIPSRDYRGVPVVGAWRWLAGPSFGVATQIDAAEAYEPLRALRRVFVFLILLLALCALGLLVFSYLNLVWRRKFNEAALKARQLGQYALEEKIGEGGMGVVYRARHALLRRDTAIKLLLPDRADADSVRQFEREVRLTCRLTHPNTIQVYDFGHTPEGIFYYAMEYLRGLSLSDLVGPFGPQRQARVIHILTQVCDSLKEAHGAGLIHRDLKPSNIFLCERGGVPDIVKVLDFGLVKHVRETAMNKNGRPVVQKLSGTPHYLPPETIKHPAHSDPRGDIYSLGAVGYYLLTGKTVFEGDSLVDICQKHVSDPPIPPRQRTANPISPELQTAILRCLEKEPEARPSSVGELGSLLRKCPEAEAWTLEDRVAWWATNVNLTVRPRPPGERELPTTVEVTVGIDLAGRTS